ncbi:hypothetical protein BC830DRAFT_1162790 [Chytriomyces sp. MP71]|nr:hypothetical protein BC830DRAFT_1162790 [Chytriomyces sp. MP71]
MSEKSTIAATNTSAAETTSDAASTASSSQVPGSLRLFDSVSNANNSFSNRSKTTPMSSQAPPNSASVTSEPPPHSSASPLPATSSSVVPPPQSTSIAPPSPSPTTAPSPSPSPSPSPVPTTTEAHTTSQPLPQTSSQPVVPTTQGPTSATDTEHPNTTGGAPSTASISSYSALTTMSATTNTGGGITSPGATGTSAPDTSSTGSSGPSTSVIAGIVTAVVLVALVALGCVWWRNIRRKGDRRYNLDDLFAMGPGTAATTARPFSMRRPETTTISTGTGAKAGGSAARGSVYSAVPVTEGVGASESPASAVAASNSGQFLVSETNGQYASAAHTAVQNGAHYDPNAYYAQYYAAYGQYPSQQQHPSARLQEASYYGYVAAAATPAEAGAATQLVAVPEKEGYPSGLLDSYVQAQPVEGLMAVDVSRATRGEAGPLPDKMQLKRESVQLWDVEDAVGWVVQNGFGEQGVVRAMQEQEIDGRSLLLLSRTDLECVLGMRDEGVRLRFERALEELK